MADGQGAFESAIPLSPVYRIAVPASSEAELRRLSETGSFDAPVTVEASGGPKAFVDCMSRSDALRLVMTFGGQPVCS